MRYFTAFVFRDSEGLGFTCPDVPGFTAHTATYDLDAAVGEARAALAGHIAAVLDAGLVIPSARDIVALRSDASLAADFAEAECIVMLPAIMPSGRTVRVNLSMDEATLAAIDRAATERRITRSAFVTEASRRLIDA